MEWAKAEEWDKIHSHVFEQAEVLRRYGTLTEGEGRRDQVVTVAAQVQDEEDPEEIREVYWDMCGTIWYNASGMVTSCEGKNSNLTVLPQDGTTYQMAKSVFDWQIASSQDLPHSAAPYRSRRKARMDLPIPPRMKASRTKWRYTHQRWAKDRENKAKSPVGCLVHWYLMTQKGHRVSPGWDG